MAGKDVKLAVATPWKCIGGSEV